MGKEILTRGNNENMIPTVIDKVTKTSGYDDYTESALARLAARDDASPIRNITRSSSPTKKLEGRRKSSMLILLAGSRSRHREVEGSRGRSKSSCSRSCTCIAGEINNNNNKHAGRKFEDRLIDDQPPPLVCIRLGDSSALPTALPQRGHGLSTVREHQLNLNSNGLSSRTNSSNWSSTTPSENLNVGIKPRITSATHRRHPLSKISSPVKEQERLATQTGASCVDTTDDTSFTSSHNGQGELNPTACPSVLENLILKGGLLLSTLLRPDPEVEDLGFQELHRDKSPKNEKPAQCENQKENVIHFDIAITAAINVPITGLKKPPLNRNVRACLYDGDKFVGNAHIFAAAKAAEEEDEPWVFINKVMDVRSPAMGYSGNDKGASRCLVQYNTPGLSLYVEVNVCFDNPTADVACNLQTERMNEGSEITCAWALLKLPNTASEVEELLAKAAVEVPLMVGSMECPVEVDNIMNMPPGRSRGTWKKGGDMSSALHFHCYKITVFQKKYSRLLPRTILASNEEVPFLVLYRKTLLDTLLNESTLLTHGGVVFSPLIQLYPWMLNERGKQLQEVFKEAWLAWKLEWPPSLDCMKKRKAKKYLKAFNNSLLMIWPLLHTHNVPQPAWPPQCEFAAKLSDKNLKVEVDQHGDGRVSSLASNTPTMDIWNKYTKHFAEEARQCTPEYHDRLEVFHQHNMANPTPQIPSWVRDFVQGTYFPDVKTCSCTHLSPCQKMYCIDCRQSNICELQFKPESVHHQHKHLQTRKVSKRCAINVSDVKSYLGGHTKGIETYLFNKEPCFMLKSRIGSVDYKVSHGLNKKKCTVCEVSLKVDEGDSKSYICSLNCKLDEIERSSRAQSSMQRNVKTKKTDQGIHEGLLHVASKPDGSKSHSTANNKEKLMSTTTPQREEFFSASPATQENFAALELLNKVQSAPFKSPHITPDTDPSTLPLKKRMKPENLRMSMQSNMALPAEKSIASLTSSASTSNTTIEHNVDGQICTLNRKLDGLI